DARAERLRCLASLVGSFTAAGLLMPAPGGTYPPAAIEITQLAHQLADHGIDERHLRSVRNGAERQLDLIEQIVAPLRSQRSGPSASGARARSHALASDLAKTFTALHTALLRAHIDRLECDANRGTAPHGVAGSCGTEGRDGCAVPGVGARLQRPRAQ